MKIPAIAGGTRILDFDIENRPLSYWVPDRPTAEITAIAACWADDPKSMRCWLLRPAFTAAEHRRLMEEMLLGFVELFDQADMVTGHYIRKHDLPIINGALMDLGLPTLGQKLSQDTKLDMVKKADIPATQAYLSAMTKVKASKYDMSQQMWREANRLVDEGLALTEKRVTDDVRQHMKLRLAMLEAGLLKAPKVWRP